jgi:hypothetical protein
MKNISFFKNDDFFFKYKMIIEYCCMSAVRTAYRAVRIAHEISRMPHRTA